MDYSIIITASYIISHPSIEHIKNVIDSLKYINMDKNTLIILAHDFSDKNKFKLYLQNLQKFIEDKPNFKITVCKKHLHLTGSIRNAFQLIKTPYVLVIQHDLPFIEHFDINKIIEDMKNNPEIKYIRFNKRENIKKGFDAINNLFGYQLKSKNYTYTKTPAWSDNNHLCLSNYYRNIVLKECPDGQPMEFELQGKIVNEELHKKYGTYIFGEIGFKKMILHTHGRRKFVKK